MGIMYKKIKLISWNVNGLRASYKKGLKDFIKEVNPDILCLQEAKAQEEQLGEEIKNIDGYKFYLNSAERKGYSGVAVYSKIVPKTIEKSFGKVYEDNEGRILSLEFDNFRLFNIYFPNGGGESHRFDYKLDFYNETLKYLSSMSKKANIVLCGDVNAAHNEIDLARPKENEKSIGFLPVEREWITSFINSGFVDTFRMFEKEGGHYTWWDLKTRARERNVGWRIDYFFVNEGFKDNVKNSYILSDVMGSDHCPIALDLSL